MLIVVQNNNSKRVIIKSVAIFSLVAMFWIYYQHMSSKFQEENMKLYTELQNKKEIEKAASSKAIRLEKIIYEEVVQIVNLLEQRNVQSIKIVDDRIVITCDFGTNIEPVLIRFGVNAMVRSTEVDIKMALDIATMIGDKYDS